MVSIGNKSRKELKTTRPVEDAQSSESTTLFKYIYIIKVLSFRVDFVCVSSDSISSLE
jgi:hypothetical protein